MAMDLFYYAFVARQWYLEFQQCREYLIFKVTKFNLQLFIQKL